MLASCRVATKCAQKCDETSRTAPSQGVSSYHEGSRLENDAGNSKAQSGARGECASLLAVTLSQRGSPRLYSHELVDALVIALTGAAAHAWQKQRRALAYLFVPGKPWRALASLPAACLVGQGSGAIHRSPETAQGGLKGAARLARSRALD